MTINLLSVLILGYIPRRSTVNDDRITSTLVSDFAPILVYLVEIDVFLISCHPNDGRRSFSSILHRVDSHILSGSV